MKLTAIKGQSKTVQVNCKKRDPVTRALTNLDISGATEITVVIAPEPTDSTATVTLTKSGGDVTFVTDGTNGQFQFTLSTTHTNRIGTYSWQFKIVTSSDTWYSAIGTIEFRYRMAAL